MAVERANDREGGSVLSDAVAPALAGAHEDALVHGLAEQQAEHLVDLERLARGLGRDGDAGAAHGLEQAWVRVGEVLRR